MNEYRLKIKIQNNLLVSAIETAGYATPAAFGRAANVAPTSISRIVSMKDSPINKSTGAFTVDARKIMDCLGALPEDLWTDEQLTLELKTNAAQTSIGRRELAALLARNTGEEVEVLPAPEDAVAARELREKIAEILDTITPREAKVIRLRFGLDDGKERTLEEIGGIIEASRERVRQIEDKALRKLKHPTRHEVVQDFFV
jgi:RNA polymerase sigma factor (sigma-70 family)